MRADLSSMLSELEKLSPALMQAVDQVADEELASALGRLQRHANLVGAALTELAGRAERSGTWAEDGHRSVSGWIAQQTGESRWRCARRVREAHLLAEMPAASIAARSGLLSGGARRLLCEARAAAPDRYDAEADETFTALAVGATVEELGRAVREWRARVEAEAVPDHDDLDPIEARQRFHLHRGPDGHWSGSFELRPDDGELLNRLVDGEVDGYLRAARDGDPSVAGLPVGALRAKALLDLVTRAARRLPGEVSAPDRYRVAILFPGDGATHLEATCDSDLYRLVLGAESEPLDVGRTTKRWTVAQRRAVTHRDRQCTFPGCDRPPSHCDVHHCRHWSEGGDTATTNGTLLCRHHHTFVHRRRWRVHLDHHQRPVYLRPDGTRHDRGRRVASVP
jgi:hypothetical protein